MHHGAIGAEIEPALIGIARDSDARRADKSAAIELMNFRHGKFQYVDSVVGHGVFKDWSCLHNLRRNRLKLVELFFESADELQSHAVHRQTGHKRETAIGSLLAKENAQSFGITLDVIEQQRRDPARAPSLDS